MPKVETMGYIFTFAIFLLLLENIRMVSYNRFTLDNGLKVIVHEDFTTPMAVVNILYDVGARDEDPDQTGFAHLFEHLMFVQVLLVNFLQFFW